MDPFAPLEALADWLTFDVIGLAHASPLGEAVAFYTGGRGHAVPRGETLSIHWHIWEPDLSDEEIDRLVDFLGALSDESYMPATPARLPSGLPLVHLQTIHANEQNDETNNVQ